MGTFGIMLGLAACFAAILSRIAFRDLARANRQLRAENEVLCRALLLAREYGVRPDGQLGFELETFNMN